MQQKHPSHSQRCVHFWTCGAWALALCALAVWSCSPSTTPQPEAPSATPTFGPTAGDVPFRIITPTATPTPPVDHRLLWTPSPEPLTPTPQVAPKTFPTPEPTATPGLASLTPTASPTPPPPSPTLDPRRDPPVVRPSVGTFSLEKVAWEHVAAGGRHTCAIDSEGAIWCWGDNSYGQLGVTGSPSGSQPVRIPNLPGQATALAAGTSHTCALLQLAGDDGLSLWCWGDNSRFQTTPLRPHASSSDALEALNSQGAEVWKPHLIPSTRLQGFPVLGGLWVRGNTTCVRVESLDLTQGLTCFGENLAGALGSSGPLNFSPSYNPLRSADGGVFVPSELALSRDMVCASREGKTKGGPSEVICRAPRFSLTQKIAQQLQEGVLGSALDVQNGHALALGFEGGILCSRFRRNPSLFGKSCAVADPRAQGDGFVGYESFGKALDGLSAVPTYFHAGAQVVCAQEGHLLWGFGSPMTCLWQRQGPTPTTQRQVSVDWAVAPGDVFPSPPSMGDNHICLVTVHAGAGDAPNQAPYNKGIQCWGDNVYGQLGPLADSGTWSAAPVWLPNRLKR